MQGFSLRGKERMEVLRKEIKKYFPDAEIVESEYFERYKWGLFSIKKTIPEYASVVRDKIGETGDDTIFVGYSLGGLIVRWMVEKMGVLAKAVILVGTPNKGINLSLKEKVLLQIIEIPCIEEMKEDSLFLKSLNRDVMPISYYYFGGRIDKRVPLELSMPWNVQQPSYARSEIIDADHSGLIPKNRKDIGSSAIPTILKILEKEISA